ncbi:MAG: phosphotransferase family protein [Acidobacteriota bacterium]|jgi:aminoglycoside phosphotransferase (APT) family kinase protein|nr:phosphotransferase family protein [Acidobacteriota bacterium]
MTNDTKPIRKGEDLNSGNLQHFLAENLSAEIHNIEISQFPAGASNLTYLIKIGGEEYVLRRPPFGNKVKTAHDMSREFNVLSKLSKIYKPAPKPIIYCGDKNIIGSEFYLMERRNGLIIRGKSPVELENSSELQKKVCESFIENLVELHSLDYKKAGLGDLGKPEGYTKRQVEGWTKRYFDSKTDEWKSLEKSIEWLNANIPEDKTATLVHNDYKFDNIMLDPENLTEIVAVLDWEMTTIGSPLMDFGTTLGYWMSKEGGDEMLSMPFNPRVLMENISRQELAEMYAEKSGRDLSNILYYYVFGTFKIAVIAQQIHYRFKKGFTNDKRFANFNLFVATLGKIANNAIEKKEI